MLEFENCVTWNRYSIVCFLSSWWFFLWLWCMLKKKEVHQLKEDLIQCRWSLFLGYLKSNLYSIILPLRCFCLLVTSNKIDCGERNYALIKEGLAHIHRFVTLSLWHWSWIFWRAPFSNFTTITVFSHIVWRAPSTQWIQRWKCQLDLTIL